MNVAVRREGKGFSVFVDGWRMVDRKSDVVADNVAEALRFPSHAGGATECEEVVLAILRWHSEYVKWLESYERARVPVFCTTYQGTTPCKRPAVGWLYPPDGLCGSGGVCWQCGTDIVTEMQAKLQECWEVRPIPEHFAFVAALRRGRGES